MSASAPTSNGSRAPIVAGAVVVVISLAVLAVGAVLVGIHATQRDGNGYYASGHNHLSTPTRALVSEKIELDTDDAPDWLIDDGRLGTLRVTASPTHAKPVFVGIAPTSKVNGYLREVDHADLTNFDLDPFSVDYTRHAGSAVPAPPASRSFWTASATGSGEQAVEWEAEKGDWSVVVMNADGSAGVATDVSVGAKFPLILWLGSAILVWGALILAGGITAIVMGRRRPPTDRPVAVGRLAEGVS
jgi:hypothetical protein